MMLGWFHVDPENVVDVLLDACSIAENKEVGDLVDGYLQHVATIDGGSWRQLVMSSWTSAPSWLHRLV